MNEVNSNRRSPYTKMTAEIYDELYAWKDYEQESARLKTIIARYQRSGGNRLLDLACGTGNHMVHLADDFELTGLDMAHEQLAVARQRMPSATFVCADILNFKLESRYDVVVCLFGSIAYMTKLSDMRLALQNVADHLVSGGLLVLEPFVTLQKYSPGRLSARMIDKPDLKISRMFVGQMQHDQAVWEMHHLVGRLEGVEYFVERHVMGLYTDEQYRRAIRDAGLRLEPGVDAPEVEGSGALLVATKP